MARKKLAKKKKKVAKKKSKNISLSDLIPSKGERMTNGNGWRLVATKGKKRVFNATLLDTINKGNVRVAIFSVPK